MNSSLSAPKFLTRERSGVNRMDRFAGWQTPPPRPRPLCNPGVLIVDDEPFIRDMLCRALRHQGFEVWQAANGFDAVDIFAEHKGAIALALVDVRMSGLDGPHTLRCLQNIDSQVQACFMSGDCGDYGEAQLLRMGARRVFWKPFVLDELIAAVRQIVRDTSFSPAPA